MSIEWSMHSDEFVMITKVPKVPKVPKIEKEETLSIISESSKTSMIETDLEPLFHPTMDANLPIIEIPTEITMEPMEIPTILVPPPQPETKNHDENNNRNDSDEVIYWFLLGLGIASAVCIFLLV